MLNHRVEKFIKNPKKALLTLAMPIMVAMLVQAAYSIVDTAFVGRLGSDAIAALTFSFPLFFILIALNAGLGTGTSSLISRFLGADKKKSAENTAMHGLVLSVILGVIVLVVGLLSLNGLFKLFGASESVVVLASGYMRIILMGSLLLFMSFMFNSIFAAQGDTKTPMMIQITALLINIVLDPIFIYVFGWGVNGAAVATVNSFFISLVLYIYFLRKRSLLHIGRSSFTLSGSIIRKILAVGFPASLMMLFMSIYSIFINRFMAFFGTDYVASLGMVSRLESLTIMPIAAFSIALVTIVGMFYGAKRYDLIKYVIFYSIKVCVGFSFIMIVVFVTIPNIFLMIFTNNPVLLSLASSYIRIHIFAFPFLAVSLICSRSMQGMGFGLPGLVTNFVRVLIIAIPLAYIFIFVFGFSYLSIAVAIIIGAFASSIIAFIWLSVKLKKLNKK